MRAQCGATPASCTSARRRSSPDGRLSGSFRLSRGDPAMPERKLPSDPRMNALPRFIFMSRWLQVPLYLGLIVAQCVYVWQFWVELVYLRRGRVGQSRARSSTSATASRCRAPTSPRSSRAKR